MDDEMPDPDDTQMTPGEGMFDGFARNAGMSPEAAEAMRDAAREGFRRAASIIPPELAAMIDAQAQAQELGQIDMGMQVTALHSYFTMLTTPSGPDRFTEAQALYYLAKLTPGL